uniref:Uncharacterized protein n=1 Tax=Pectinophora gossypiella TaxID=13191 RepID=A0A1E1WA20_PECGO
MHSRVNTTDTAHRGDSPLTPAALRTAGGLFACAREPQPTDTQTLVRCHVCAAPNRTTNAILAHQMHNPRRSPLDHKMNLQRAASERDRRSNFLSTIHRQLRGLTNKIITNVHEMLAVLCARGLRHTIDKIL